MMLVDLNLLMAGKLKLPSSSSYGGIRNAPDQCCEKYGLCPAIILG